LRCGKVAARGCWTSTTTHRAGKSHRVNRFLKGAWRQNSVACAARPANHLALIRSFLIDFGPRPPPREVICANFFCVVHDADRIAKNENKNAGVDKECFGLTRLAESDTHKKSLFHRMFLNSRILDAKLSRASVQTNCMLCVSVPIACFGDEFASLTHTMK
jgi:hypothetical protein